MLLIIPKHHKTLIPLCFVDDWFQAFVYISGDSEDYQNDLLISPVATIIKGQLAYISYAIDGHLTNGVLEIYPATETGHVTYHRRLYNLLLAGEASKSYKEVWICKFFVFSSPWIFNGCY